MPRTAHSTAAPGPLELLEEAVALLRASPAATLLSYYLGALPFALGWLWFCTDLSRGADATQRLPAAALGLALLYAWLKTWQAVFARQLLRHLCGESAVWPAPGEVLRLAATQLIVQPAGLFFLPLALGTVALFPHTCAFFHSATALAARPDLGTRALLRQAAQEASRWPWQNFQGLALLLLFGAFVGLNVLSAALALPFLLKTLLGVESEFTRSSATLLNPTTLLALLTLTWLCLDPILKAFYVLRCFHGDSLRTGQDLRAQLRRLAAAGAAGLVLLLTTGAGRADFLVCQFTGPPSSANPVPALALAGLGTGQLESRPHWPTEISALLDRGVPAEAPDRTAGQPVPAEDLDRAISETLNHPEYDWRPPRARAEGERGWLLSKLDDLAATLRDGAERFADWLAEWLRKLFRGRSGPGSSGVGGIALTRTLLIVLIVVLAALVAVAVVRAWRAGRSGMEVAAQPLAAIPDLEAQDVHAGQLPADGWSRLATELLERGEFRLALRALYLASLALLAERGLLTLARFKSNRDYQRELERRAHALPGLAERFGENVRLVDRVWYGRHEISRAAVEQFARGVEEMRGQAG